MNLPEIKTPNWQMSLEAPEAIVTELDDISQCIRTVCQTEKGTDPLRPLFGVGFFQYVDTPIQEAIPNLIAEITAAIERWETRATITKIEYTVTESQLAIRLHWKTATENTAITQTSYELK